MKNKKIFPWVVGFAAFTVSGSAAYYSVYGISKMFAGASTNVMIMAASLEFSKLVIASLLYTYWGNLNKILRGYLTVACCILVLITSAGIYGFLSSAYQETANKVEVLDKQNGSLDKQKILVQSEIKRYESQLSQKDNRINSLSEIKSKQQGTMDNLISKNLSIKGVKTQMASIDQEIAKLDNEVKIINDSLNSKNEKLKQLDLQSLGLQTNQDVAKEVGPLKYIAKLTGKSLDQVVNWFIIALMLVFDPLAVSLVIALNFILAVENSKRTAVAHTPEDKDIEEKKEEETPEEIDPIEDEPEEDLSMDINEIIAKEAFERIVENEDQPELDEEDSIEYPLSPATFEIDSDSPVDEWAEDIITENDLERREYIQHQANHTDPTKLR